MVHKPWYRIRILAAGKQYGHACGIEENSISRMNTEEPLLLHDHTYL